MTAPDRRLTPGQGIALGCLLGAAIWAAGLWWVTR